ncbi:MAG: FAD-dependent thymidylate synthase [Crocinitomix sp.]|nr:FAD-dependent thymidylate synthase [Crocinitomix sp.]
MEVTYEDHMGDDLKVVNMARVSFGKRSEWADEYTHEGKCGPRLHQELSEADQSLIKFLARGCTSGDWGDLSKEVAEEGHSLVEYMGDDTEFLKLLNHLKNMPSHWAPFAHCQITLHVKVPLFVQRQLDKHQVGFTTSESSRRYITDGPEFYVPDVWRKAADNVKQGSSSDEVDVEEDPDLGRYHTPESFNGVCLSYYTHLLDLKVASEQARMVLPQSMYVESFKTGSLYGWANLYNQRSDPHAQKETQMVAEQIKNIIQPLYPYSWEALTNG